MGFKKYIVATILLLAVIAGYTYSLDLGTYTLSFDMGIKDIAFSQELPIYIWVIVSAIILFIFSLLHMVVFYTKTYFTKNMLNKDIKNISLIIKDKLLKQNSTVILKTKEMIELGNVLNQLDLNLNKKLDTSISLVSKVALNIEKVYNGEYVSTKELKLPNDNEIMVKNILNRVNSDTNFAIEVLKNQKDYKENIVKNAFNNVIENKSFSTVKKLVSTMDLTKDMVTMILEKDATSPKEFSLSNSEILVYIQDNKFTNNELIELAKQYKKIMSPEQLIKLFEDIASNDESLTFSYLYVLFEYEMLKQIREILVNSQKDEFIVFKALLDLKDAGKYYNIDDLIIK